MIRTMVRELVLVIVVLLSASGRAAGADNLFTVEDRRALDLERYVVTDPHAGYFDVDARMRWLRKSQAPILKHQIDRLSMGVGCRDKLALPIIDHKLHMPAFYEDQASWREAIRPFFAFEDAVSDLAGAYVASGDRYFADCLIDLLHAWAVADALTRFHYTSADRQAWFNIEDMLFAAGLAYSTVRHQIEDRAAETAAIDAWLANAARIHLSIGGGPSSCCNNHFYRRALYATVIGIMNTDDDLFRVGVSALYSALHEIGAHGQLLRETARGSRALHYQNYALLHLILIAELIERQGYAAYTLGVDGRTLEDAVKLTLEGLENPARFRDLTPSQQDLRFIGDKQYFAWMEIYLGRFRNPWMERWLAERRPIYNRSAGGHITLFFNGT